MSVYERQREIGVMRSVGATSGIVMLQFLTEGLLVGFAAWVLGLPIAYVLSNLILDVTGLSDTLNAVFSLQAVLAGLLGIMVITTLASLLPALVAARHTVSDILRYQ
jgi:putative ABC transport system permease protein